jgi:cbb3-type cytochrome oxidase subunit 3
MDFLDFDDNKSAKVRQEEITGDQHIFHSLPKELQVVHNGHYMMEKKTHIDLSTVPLATLNAYMWKVIWDATKYGIPSAILIIGSIVKLKLSPNGWGLFLSLAFIIPWALWIGYHFMFYAIIKAQVVGEATKRMAQYTADVFYSTYLSIVFSLVVAFVYIMWILEDIIMWIREKIIHLESSGGFMSDKIVLYLKKLHNVLVDLIVPPEGTFNSFLFNTYTSTILLTIIFFGIVFLLERFFYKNRKQEVEEEMRLEELDKGYAFEKAMKVLEEQSK